MGSEIGRKGSVEEGDLGVVDLNCQIITQRVSREEGLKGVDEGSIVSVLVEALERNHRGFLQE